MHSNVKCINEGTRLITLCFKLFMVRSTCKKIRKRLIKMTTDEEKIILRYIYLNELPTFMDQPPLDTKLPLTGIPPEVIKQLQAAYRQAVKELETIRCSIFIKTIDSTPDKWVFEGYQHGERFKFVFTPDQLREKCREVYREIKKGAL